MTAALFIQLINERTQAIWLRDAWVTNYGHSDPTTRDKLIELGASPTPDEVDDVFKSLGNGRGNGNRVNRIFCCESCSKDGLHCVIRFNRKESEWERSLDVCSDCLLTAFRLLEGDIDPVTGK